MNTYQISIHIRKFKRIPPVGTYFNLGVGEGLGIILLPHGVQLGWGGRGGIIGPPSRSPSTWVPAELPTLCLPEAGYGMFPFEKILIWFGHQFV